MDVDMRGGGEELSDEVSVIWFTATTFCVALDRVRAVVVSGLGCWVAMVG